MRGNATGKTVGFFRSAWFTSGRPSTILTPKYKSRKEPASAKWKFEIPNSWKTYVPRKRNPTIIHVAMIVDFRDSILPLVSLKLMMRGMFPTISITAKRVTVAVRMLVRFILLLPFSIFNVRLNSLSNNPKECCIGNACADEYSGKHV